MIETVDCNRRPKSSMQVIPISRSMCFLGFRVPAGKQEFI